MLTSRLRDLRGAILDGTRSDAEGDRYTATVSVWGRWILWTFVLAEAAYRPEFSGGTYIPFILLHAVMVGGNALVHYRAVRRMVTGRSWILAQCVADYLLITASIVSDGGSPTSTTLLTTQH